VAAAMHLVLAYRPGWQSLDDLTAIARHVRELDSEIGTFILPGTSANNVSRGAAARLPTLVVSPALLTRFKPIRGKVYQGWPVPKIEELRRLHVAGVPVPLTTMLTPELKLDPAVWGELVVVKPTDIPSSSHGNGISLVRTSRVRFRPQKDYPAGHPGRAGPMMVQQYIDTGDKIAGYRVLTFFGEPLLAYLTRGSVARLNRNAPDDVIERAVIAIQAVANRERMFIADADVLALARAAHAAIPEIPLKGCDIIRQAATGRLFVLELNCGGNTWQFSSDIAESIRQFQGPEFVRYQMEQFDALRTAARVLVERTRREAE
jgi:hypothetical protein